MTRPSMTKFNNGRFTSERLKGNKYALGNKPNKTSFKHGHVPHNAIGYLKPRTLFHSRDGVQVVSTIPDQKPAVSRGRRYMTRKRVAYARVVIGLQQIPKGCVVVHLDGNPLNNAKRNLKVMTRAQLLKYNQGER